MMLSSYLSFLLILSSYRQTLEEERTDFRSFFYKISDGILNETQTNEGLKALKTMTALNGKLIEHANRPLNTSSSPSSRSRSSLVSSATDVNEREMLNDDVSVFQLSPRIVKTESATYRGFVRAVRMKHSKRFAMVETFRGIQFASLRGFATKVDANDISANKRRNQRFAEPHLRENQTKTRFIVNNSNPMKRRGAKNIHDGDNDLTAKIHSSSHLPPKFSTRSFYSSTRFMPPSALPIATEAITLALDFAEVCPQRFPNAETLSKMDALRRRKLSRIKEDVRGYKGRENVEDCLFLNLYVPFEESNDLKNLFPVLVFIHGESYDFGTGNVYDGTILASRARVVVVTINYRLGPLGFLATQDSHSPGNYALQDITACLHWLKHNIKNFLGDASLMTIMGHGYGAAMVNMLLISRSPVESRLFKRVILMSGSAHSDWSTTHHPLLATTELSNHVNCSVIPTLAALTYHENETVDDGDKLKITGNDFIDHFSDGEKTSSESSSSSSSSSSWYSDNSSKQMESALIKRGIYQTSRTIDCLKRIPVDRLLSEKVTTLKRFKPTFAPTEDRKKMSTGHKSFKTEQASGNVEPSITEEGSEIEMMIGVNEEDGMYFFGRPEIDHDNPTYLLKNFVQEMFNSHKQAIYNVLKHQYNIRTFPKDFNQHGKWNQTTQKYYSELADFKRLATTFLTDSLFVAPMFDTLRKYSSLKGIAKKAFVYISERRSFTGYDDLSMVFGDPLADDCCTPLQFYDMGYEDTSKEEMSASITELWSNFIYYGDPNVKRQQNQDVGTSQSIPQWPEYSKEAGKYLKIDENVITVGENYRAEKISLWLDLIPRLHGPLDQNSPITFNNHLHPNTRIVGELSDSSNTDPAALDRSSQQNQKKSLDPTNGLSSNANLFSISVPPRAENFPEEKTFSARKDFPLNTISPLSSSQIKSVVVETTRNNTIDKNSVHDVLPFRITLVVGLSLLCLNIVAFSVVCLAKRYQGNPNKKSKQEYCTHDHEINIDEQDARPGHLSHSNENFLKSPSVDEPNHEASSTRIALIDTSERADLLCRDVVALNNFNPSDHPPQILSTYAHLRRDSFFDPHNKMKRCSRDKGVHFLDEIDLIRCPTSENFDRANNLNHNQTSAGHRSKTAFSQSTV